MPSSSPDNQLQKSTTVLIILDGFGHSETSQSNAIEHANTPCWDHLWAESPRSLVQTSGLAVGLPEGQMGNSEVGHMNLGAGRIVYQNLTRISKAIDDGNFFENPQLKQAVDSAVNTDKALHILGLLSPGGVHSHEDHILAMIDLAAKRGAKKVYLHAFLDGRDTPPKSAEASLRKAQTHFETQGCGAVVSLIGRYYAMDRDNRWDRIQTAYDLLTQGKAKLTTQNALEGLKNVYGMDESDEFCPSVSICRDDQARPTIIEDGDSVVFMNFRPDRARELTRAFVDDELVSLDRKVRPKLAQFVTLTQYASDIHAPCAYPPETLSNTLGEYLSNLGKTQLRIAETEKYAHVTFFFNGGREEEFDGETRLLIPSPQVATYDLKPEMSAFEVTERLVAAIKSQEYDLIVCNYANGDMVGHTGNMQAAIKAVETLDQCLQQVNEAILGVGGSCLITADHGNVELMLDPETGSAVTSHTKGPVPLVLVSESHNHLQLKPGRLCDIAPSILSLMGLSKPEEMQGESLLTDNRSLNH